MMGVLTEEEKRVLLGQEVGKDIFRMVFDRKPTEEEMIRVEKEIEVEGKEKYPMGKILSRRWVESEDDYYPKQYGFIMIMATGK